MSKDYEKNYKKKTGIKDPNPEEFKINKEKSLKVVLNVTDKNLEAFKNNKYFDVVIVLLHAFKE